MTILVLVAWLAIRLADHPVRLAFLTPYVEDALTTSDGRLAVRLDDTVLLWNGETGMLEIRALGVQARGAAQAIVATVPEMSLSLSGSALLRGAVALKGLRLFRPSLHVATDGQGGWQIGVGDAAGATPGSAPVLADGLKALLSAPGQVQRIDILGGDLVIDDTARHHSWHAPRVDLKLRREGRGASGSLRMDVDLGGHTASLDGQGSLAADQRTIDATLGFDGIDPSQLAELVPALAPAAGLHLGLSGSLRLRYELDLGLADLGFTVSSADGVIDMSTSLGSSWPVSSAEIRGRWSAAGLIIDLCHIDLGTGRIDVGGKVDILGGAAAVTADLRVESLRVDDLAALWPPAVAPHPRAWILANLSKGRVPWASAHLAAHLPAGAAPADLVVDAINGELVAEGVTVHYLDPMPPVHEVAGKARFDAQAFVIDVTAGQVMDLKLEEGVVNLTGLSDPDQFADISLKIGGPVTDALRLIDNKPLQYAHALGIEPARVRGDASTRLDLKFPLENNLGLDRIHVHAASQVTRLVVPAVALGLDLQDGAVALEVDTAGLDLSGSAVLAGRPAKIKWRENFGKAAFRSRYQVSASLDEAGRKTVGLGFPPFQPPFMSGELPVELVATFLPAGRAEIAVKADLAPVSLRLPGLNLDKPAATAGAGEAEILLVNNRLAEIPRFTVTAGHGLDIEGHVAFDDGRPRQIRFNRAKWRHTDVSGVLSFEPGGLRLEVGGASVDAREAMSGHASDPVTDKARPKSGERPEKPPPAKREEVVPLIVHGKVGEVWVSDSGALKDLTIDASRDSFDWQKAHIDARTADGAPFSLDLRPLAAKRREVKVAAGDAGAVFRSFEMFENVVGGQLTIEGVYDDGDPRQPLSGQATVTDYQVLKAPALARLLTVAALTGIVEVLSGEGIHFQILDVPFTLTEGLLQVHDARASGPSLGLTAKGSLDLETDRLALEGTVVPVYLLNSALGKLPFLGSLFSAEKGGGVLAMTYSMKGPAEDPGVSVNPLSALTPGFLRRLFDVFDEGGKSGE